MNTSTIEKTSTEPKAAGNQPKTSDSKAHAGPVAKLLAQVTSMAQEYADYKVSKCDWRKISI